MNTATQPLPACLTRDNLTSPYFPNLSLAGLTATVALGNIFILTSLNRLNHTDLWGHLNFGRWMVEHQGLPNVDPFAAAPTAAPVLNAAWLAQVTGYHVYRLLGNEGLVLGHALLVALTAGILMLAVYRRGAPATWAWTAGIAMFLLDLPIVGTVRPQLFGQLGAALFLFACAELPKRKHPLIWIPIVAAFWANLHGSILMGLAILGIYALGVTFNAAWSLFNHQSTGAHFSKLWIVWTAVALASVAACLNPHGPMLLVQTLFFNDHAALASIREWAALRPGSLTGVLMIVSILLTAILAKFSPRKWEACEVLLLVVFGLATLSAIRMLAWWALIWPWVCVPHVAAVWKMFLAKGNTATSDNQPTAMRTVMAMGFVFMSILIAPPTFSLVSGKTRGDGLIMVTDTPLYVADEIVRRNLSGNVAAPMDWADFLIWKTDGKLRPLVYSHVHLTAASTWSDYQSIYRGDEQWLELLRQHHMQYVLVPRKPYSRLAQLVLLEDRTGKGGARIIYQDQRCVLAEVLPAGDVPSTN